VNLPDFIRKKAAACGLETPAELHHALQEAGAELTYEAVHHWWSGKSRPERHAATLIKVLRLSSHDRLLLYELPLAA
jgi:hypothetical protein